MTGVNERRRGIGRSALDAAKPGGWGFGSKGNALPVTETWDSSVFHTQGEWGPQRGSDLVTITQQVMAILGLGPSSSDLQPKAHSSPSNGDLNCQVFGTNNKEFSLLTHSENWALSENEYWEYSAFSLILFPSLRLWSQPTLHLSVSSAS